MRKQLLTSTLTLILLSLAATAILSETVNQAYAASSPILKVEPNLYMAEELGDEFNLNVTIYNITANLHLIGIHFRLSYNSELLEVVDVSEGDFLPKFNQTSSPPATLFVWSTEEVGVFGPHVVVGDILLPNATGKFPGPYPEGNGTVASITFKVIYQPVEPESIQVCLLRFLEVILLDDQGAEIICTTSISLYESPEPMLYPEPSFTYQPEYPMAGQVILFNATESEDPDGNITTYSWDFDDGTTLSTNESVVTHMYTQPKTYNVTLYTIDDDGLMSNISIPIQVGFYTPIKIEIETGEVYYPGETTEFYIQTSQLGRPLNVTFDKTSLYFNGSLYKDLDVSLIQLIGDGFYRASYAIPEDAEAGVYVLQVEAECSNITSTGIASFQVSETLISMNKTIAAISGDLSAIDAKLISLNGTVAVINSTLGLLTTNIANINLTVTEINEGIATVETSLGTIQGKITNIEDEFNTGGAIATIETDIGTVKADVSDFKGSQGTSITLIYIAIILALIAAIAAIISVIQTWKK